MSTSLTTDLAVRSKMEAASDEFLSHFLNVGSVSVVFFYGLQSALLPTIGLPYNLLIFLFLVFLPARLALLTRYRYLARWWFVCSFSFCILALPWFVNGVRTPVLLASPLALLLVSWFLGRRSLVWFSVLHVGELVALWWAERFGGFVPPLAPRSIDVWLLTALEVTTLVVVASWALTRNYESMQAAETRLHDDLAAEAERANAARKQLSEIYDGLSAHVCVLDSKGIIQNVNKAWREFFLANGGSPERKHEGTSYLEACTTAIRSPSADLNEATKFYELLQEVLEGRRNQFEMEYPCHSPTEKRWFFVRVSRLKGVLPMRVLVAHDDVTLVKLAQEQLHASLTFTRSLIESMQEGFSVLDSMGHAFDANPALCRMTGFSREELIDIQAPFPYWPEEEYDNIRKAFEKTLSGAGGEFELVFKRKSDERFPVSVTASAVKDAQGHTVNYVATVTDITERKEAQAQVQRLAFFDPLTNLPNRRLLTDRMDFALASFKRSGKFAGLLLLDLDNFKPLNDTHGHAMGDLLLIEVATRVRTCVRELDTVARVGGDEFVVLIHELGADALAPGEQLAMIAEKIRLTLSQPFRLSLDGKAWVEHHCSSSIGGVLLGGQLANVTEASKLADQAMYRAKREGRNRVCLEGLQTGL